MSDQGSSVSIDSSESIAQTTILSYFNTSSTHPFAALNLLSADMRRLPFKHQSDGNRFEKALRQASSG